ncbi:MAG: hypothetical protein ACOYXT_04080 [Bacteroidota bacterium]
MTQAFLLESGCKHIRLAATSNERKTGTDGSVGTIDVSLGGALDGTVKPTIVILAK